MDFDTQVKLAIYRHFAEMGRGPSPEEIAVRVGSDAENVLASYHRLRTQRLLVLDSDNVSIRMAPPVFWRAHPACCRSRWYPIFCQLCLGFPGHSGGFTKTGRGSLSL